MKRNLITYSVASLNSRLSVTLTNGHLTYEEKLEKVILYLVNVEGYLGFNNDINKITYQSRDINELVSFSSSIIPMPNKMNHNYDKVLSAANITYQEEAFATRIINAVNALPDAKMRKFVWLNYILKHSAYEITAKLNITRTIFYRYYKLSAKYIISYLQEN